MTSTIPRKGDRVRVSWEDGPVARTAEFVVDEYHETGKGDRRYPELAYKNALGRGFFVIGPGYSVEVLEAIPQPEYLEPVPGMVLRGHVYDFIVTPGGYFDVANGILHELEVEPWRADYYTVVFDPRNAEALPNPLGIRVGDTVRRVVNPESGKAKITTEFVVNHIDTTGAIYPIYGSGFRPDGFEVTSREVPSRFPAGTILRGIRGFRDQGLRLITERGGYYLDMKGGPTADKSDYAKLVRDGYLEVIYLP